MVYYKPVKITINIPSQVEMIINMLVCYYRVPKSIIMDQNLLFTSKFLSLLCYFFKIKKAIYNLSLINRWPNRKGKKHNGSVFQSICQLRTKQLSKIIANS